jgi:hypothetical protein
MKTIIVPKRSQRGSVLLVSLVITFIIGITLASYLIMTQNQNVSVARSQTWNSSIALSEAGVEDALAMLNRNGGNVETLYNWTNSAALSADNWTALGANVYYTRRYLGSNYYDAYITNLNNTPSIRSVGTVALNSALASAPQSFFAAAGVANPSPRPTVTRKIEVRTKIDPLFALAMAAIQQIDMNGNNIATDSFDSADNNFSNGGLYPSGDLSKTKANGDVVTDYTILNALNVGNADIKGVVKTGPHGTVSIGPNGSVGDKAWVEGGNNGIQPGHSADDMNVVFDPVTLPTGATTWLPPGAAQTGQTINGTSYAYAFTTPGSYDYRISGSLSGSVYVGPGVTVRLYVTGNISLNNKTIDLAAGGSLLKIYLGGSLSMAGNGAINNDNQNAANFYLFGLPTCTSISLGGNGALTGVIYAPQAELSLSGGGNNTYDFVGSSVSKSVRMNGHFNFHYDENLRRVGPGRGYIPTNWKEVQ